MLFVADTQALVWVQTKQERRLGKQARKAFQRADQGQALIYVSAASLLELEWLEAGRKLLLKESLEDLVRRWSTVPGYDIWPLTPEIILRSRKFRDLESMDRLIVATAEELDCPLITSDMTIQQRRPLPIVWD